MSSKQQLCEAHLSVSPCRLLEKLVELPSPASSAHSLFSLHDMLHNAARHAAHQARSAATSRQGELQLEELFKEGQAMSSNVEGKLSQTFLSCAARDQAPGRLTSEMLGSRGRSAAPWTHGTQFEEQTILRFPLIRTREGYLALSLLRCFC